MPSIAPERAQTPAEHERALLAVNKKLGEQLRARHAENPYSVVYERYSLWSYAAMEFAREEGIPAILEVNAPLLEEQSRQQLLIHRAAAEDATMRAFRSATVISVVSHQLAHIIAEHPSVRGKVHVVPNAADPGRFEGHSPTVRYEPGQFVVGFVGELRPWQGLNTLLAAFAMLVDALPEARLLIVGDGSDREPLQRDVAARRLEQQVRFVGEVSPHAMPGYLASMHAAVAPYPQLAGFYASPLKLFEYMAAGLPVVASRIGQVSEIIRHERTGLLVPPGDKQALAEMLYELEQDPAKRQRIGKAARARVVSAHSWDATLDHVLQLAGTPAYA